MNTQEYLITLNVPPGIEESMVDCLLTFESEHGFTTFPVYAHDHRNLGLSLDEQVTGRQKKIRFQMYIEKNDISALLSKLKTEFSGSGIHYWLMPVIEKGLI